MAVRKRVPNTAQLLIVLAAASLSTSLGGDTGKPTKDTSVGSQLVLRMTPTSPVVIMFERVAVEWELQNVGQKAVYVCQWPGIAFSQRWECPNGVIKAGIPGYPHSKPLERKYYLELKPGEALFGYRSVSTTLRH